MNLTEDTLVLRDGRAHRVTKATSRQITLKPLDGGRAKTMTRTEAAELAGRRRLAEMVEVPPVPSPTRRIRQMRERR